MKLLNIHIRDEDAPACLSLLQTLLSVFMIVGPVLGTFVYQQTGIEMAILMTGICFLLSAAAMLSIPPDPDSSKRSAAHRTSVSREMAEGLRYVIHSKALLRLSLCFVFVGLGVGLITPLSIFLVTERLGLPAQHLQWVTIPYGVGEIAGGIATFMLAAKMAPQRLLTIGLFVNGAGIVMLGLSSALWLTMVSQLTIALLQPAIFAGNHALTMQQTEQPYIGRVTGIRTPLMTGAMLLMMGFSGAMKNALSLTVMYELAGCCFFVGLLFVLPLLRHSRNRPSPGQT